MEHERCLYLLSSSFYILNAAPSTQNATTFEDDDDPHIGVATDFVSNSLTTTRTINPKDDNLHMDDANDFVPDSLLSV